MRVCSLAFALPLAFAAPEDALRATLTEYEALSEEQREARISEMGFPGFPINAHADPRFTCAKPAGKVPPPKDISELHPSHVSLVMAVGDSITAAFSARNNLDEARDISFSGGVGSASHVTLPWLLTQYSGKVEGAATKAVFPKNAIDLPHGDYHSKTDEMNVAQSMGAAFEGSLEEQWALLESNFGKYANFEKRWKVMTVWMFANDVCGMCKYPAENSQLYSTWQSKMTTFLDEATSKLNNTYINLLSMLDLSHINRIQQSDWLCKFMHNSLFEECGCVDRGSKEELKMLDLNIAVMNNRSAKFAQDYTKKLHDQGRRDIAVVYHDFAEGVGPELDKHFLSRLDCFHPAAEAHQDLAAALWNSMLCHDRDAHCGQTGYKRGLKPVCPTVNSTFYTGLAPAKPAAVVV